MTLSRVGFSLQQDGALVCIGNHIGPVMGWGAYIFLKKQDGAWVIETEAVAWKA
jgi:hypothetical protein